MGSYENSRYGYRRTSRVRVQILIGGWVCWSDLGEAFAFLFFLHEAAEIKKQVAGVEVRGENIC